MDSVIYLEPDEEITSVIDKLKKVKTHEVGIVAPRNAVLMQSIVNLKLLKKQAGKLKKDISLVTADHVGQNLALRTGLTVFANIHDTKPLPPLKMPKPDNIIEEKGTQSVPSISNLSDQDLSAPEGITVRHYKQPPQEDLAGESENLEDLEGPEEPAFSSHNLSEANNEAAEKAAESPDSPAEELTESPKPSSHHPPDYKSSLPAPKPSKKPTFSILSLVIISLILEMA